MGWLKKKYKATKEQMAEDWKQKAAAQAETRKLSREAYFKAKQEHQIALAKAKAKYQREAQERAIKSKYAPKPKIQYKGFGGQRTMSSMMSIKPSGIMSPGYFAPATPKAPTKKAPIKRRRKQKKKKGGYIIRGGRAYPIG